MPSPRFPFLKDLPPAQPLVVVEPRRHAVYSPLCCAPRLSQFPKSPLSITFPWFTEAAKPGAETAKSFMQGVMAEYKELFPGEPNPSSLDLIRWLYQRSTDAEMHSAGLDTEVNRLEEVNERLEKEITQMAADVRIRSASHGI